MPRAISVSEVSKHQTPDDIWIAVNGHVYDMTTFAPEHPGGSAIIYRYAGRDASVEYNAIHSPSLIKQSLPTTCHIGSLDESIITAEWNSVATQTRPPGADGTAEEKPALHDIINLGDFEDVARKHLAAKPWASINGGTNDNITRDANTSYLRRIWLRPRVMRKVGQRNTNTRIFGCNLSLPVFISPTGGAKMGGSEGELTLAQGAAASGIIHCFATPSSYTYDEILAATPERAFFQLYVDKDRSQSEKALRKVISTGKIRAILVTADVPVIPKRDQDERIQAAQVITLGGISTPTVAAKCDKRGAGTARLASAFIDPNVSWNDIKWLRSIVGQTPIVIKGIQCASDALIAMNMGYDGIVIGNHGGRAQDTAPPAILTLLEINKLCPEVLSKMEVLIDGGFRRGSDIVKAICLGASAVGLGRPFLYALGYGQEGIEHAVSLLKDEIETCMSLCGMTDLMSDAQPDFVNTNDIDYLISDLHHPYARKVTRHLSKI